MRRGSKARGVDSHPRANWTSHAPSVTLEDSCDTSPLGAGEERNLSQGLRPGPLIGVEKEQILPRTGGCLVRMVPAVPLRRSSDELPH